METATTPLRTAIFTTLSLLAFAINSLLCRTALGGSTIDAPSFASIRLVAAALTLLLGVGLLRRNVSRRSGSWTSAAVIFLYAITFSFAYAKLSTGTGALILFGAVQVTMILSGIRAGERPSFVEWAGLVIALGGLIYLVLPGLASPPLSGAVLMTVAGVAWGIYSLRGRNNVDPFSSTAGNLIRSIPFAFASSLITYAQISLSKKGVLFAVASGVVTTGIGYILWYTALQGLTATRAATVQLSVPILAAFGGIIFLSESLTIRLVLSALLILGGVGIAMVWRGQRTRELSKDGRLGAKSD